METPGFHKQVIFRFKDHDNIPHTWRKGTIVHTTENNYTVAFVVDGIVATTTITRNDPFNNIEVVEYTKNNKWLIGTTHFYFDRKIEYKDKELVLVANDYFDNEDKIVERNMYNNWLIAAFCYYHYYGDDDDGELTPDDRRKQCYNVYNIMGKESEDYYDYCIPYKGNEHLLGELIQKEHLINYVK